MTAITLAAVIGYLRASIPFRLLLTWAAEAVVPYLGNTVL